MTVPPLTVLLVDDHPEDVRRIRELVDAAKGVQVVLEQASCLLTGLTRLAQGGIELVLLDLSLPDGQGLAAVMKVNAQAPEVPCVVLIDGDDEGMGLRALQAGAQDYLVKADVTSRELVRALRYAVERKRKDKELRKLHAQTEQLLTSISSIVIGVSLEGRITQWNAVAQAAFGLPSAKVLGQPLSTSEIQWETARVFEGIAACQGANQPARVENIRFTRPDGMEGLLGITISPIRDVAGLPIGCLILGADITERVKAQEMLDTKVKELEALNRIMMGREERILELKEELRALRAQLNAQVPER